MEGNAGRAKASVLLILALAAAACATPAPAPPSAPVSDDKAVVKEASRKTADECQPGKEHWREAGPPKRGGTFTRSGGGPPNLELTRASVNAPGPHVYQPLLAPRGCYYGDGIMLPLLAQKWVSLPTA